MLHFPALRLERTSLTEHTAFKKIIFQFHVKQNNTTNSSLYLMAYMFDENNHIMNIDPIELQYHVADGEQVFEAPVILGNLELEKHFLQKDQNSPNALLSFDYITFFPIQSGFDYIGYRLEIVTDGTIKILTVINPCPKFCNS